MTRQYRQTLEPRDNSHLRQSLMEISSMLIWALVLVSLIVFIVLLVKAFKSWGVAHTILLTILFIESWTFLFFAGGVAHYRITLTKNSNKLEEKVEGLLKTVDMELYGDRNDPKLNLEKFVPLANELNRLTVERGRVWRGATMQRAIPATATTPATVILQIPPSVSNLPPAVPAATAGAGGADAILATAQADSGLAAASVIYLFGEKVDGIMLFPESYLGEFIVSEVKDLEIKVRPTTPFSQLQDSILRNSASWSIYELMPLDSHTAFAAAGSSPEEGAKFGRMDKDGIAADLGIDPSLADKEPGSLSVREANKARVLQSYLNDGARAPDQTPPEALAYEVKFLKEYTLVVDAKGGRLPLEGGYHDLEGSMVDERLKRDSDAGVVFKVDDQYVFDAPTANRLKDEGFVELQSAVFVRPLNDYAFAFREIRRSIIRAFQDANLINRESKEAVRSTEVQLKQEINGEEEGTKLKLDKAQYEKELTVIASVVSDLETQIKTKRTELSQIYSSIVAIHNSLVTQQREQMNTVNALLAP